MAVSEALAARGGRDTVRDPGPQPARGHSPVTPGFVVLQEAFFVLEESSGVRLPGVLGMTENEVDAPPASFKVAGVIVLLHTFGVRYGQLGGGVPGFLKQRMFLFLHSGVSWRDTWGSKLTIFGAFHQLPLMPRYGVWITQIRGFRVLMPL